MRKNLIKGGFLALFCLLFSLFLLFSPHKDYQAGAVTPSKAECVVEVSSRRFLARKQEDRRLPMASTTKILTAITVIDDCNLDEKYTVPQEAEGIEGSSVYLKAGEQYTVRDLLYGLMLRSGNDCAVALALYHSGSIRDFAQKMNEKAVKIGAQESHFVNPHGLPDKRHYTTACDLAVIASYAMENSTFCEIVSCKYYEPRNWKNKNKMLERYEGAIGVKTGFTMDAGRCLVTSAERKGMKLVCVVLNSPQMYERTAELLDECYTKYQMTRLFDCNQAFDGLKAKQSFSYPLLADELDKIQIKSELFAEKPNNSGEIAGQMQIFLEKNLIFSQNLYMM